MTKLKNIALAKRIIRKDCMIRGDNIDNDGNTCVVGALGLAALGRIIKLRKQATKGKK